jgi:hypothetical protein
MRAVVKPRDIAGVFPVGPATPEAHLSHLLPLSLFLFPILRGNQRIPYSATTALVGLDAVTSKGGACTWRVTPHVKSSSLKLGYTTPEFAPSADIDNLPPREKA